MEDGYIKICLNCGDRLLALAKKCPFCGVKAKNFPLINRNDREKIAEAINNVPNPKSGGKTKNKPRTSTSASIIKVSQPSFFAKLNSKKVKETQCTCFSCGAVWHFNNSDVGNNLANALLTLGGTPTQSAIGFNKIQDFDKCPKCGSRKIQKKIVFFLVDKKGNYIE